MGEPSSAAPAARPDPEPRQEFRIFGRALAGVFARLRAAGEPRGAEAREDCYLLVRGRTDVSLKLRGGALDLKLLSDRVGRLERWVPVAAVELPAGGALLTERFFGPAGLPRCLAEDTDYDAAALVSAARPLAAVRVVTVGKRRQRFAFGEDLGECTDVAVERRETVRSCAVEGPDPARLEALIGRLGLAGRENVSYPRYLLRVASGDR